ncbi:hypothetical protein SNE40_005321 [Patella caerulea]
MTNLKVDESVSTTYNYLSYFSCWTKMRKAVGWILVLMELLRKLAKRRKEFNKELEDEPDDERKTKLVDRKVRQLREKFKE